MSKILRALHCAFLVLVLLQTTSCGRHSYPSSRGKLSGSGTRHSSSLSGGHGYPGHQSSGHGYPSSGGMSGSGGHGSNAGYPKSGGMSGSGSGYPHSGSSGYPATSVHTSGSQTHGYPPNRNTHTTVVNHNYHYTPPQQIRYAAPGQTAQSYPVYHGTPPTYVYQYKDSGSKYGTLLTGLALLNLGTLGASVYAASKAGSSSSSSGSEYKSKPGEYCKFGIKKDNGDYEETRIDCSLISSFILKEEQDAKTRAQSGGTNTVVTTTTTNVTTVNMTNGVPDVVQTTTTEAPILYQKLPDGSLVPVNVTLPSASVNNTQNATAANGTVMTSSVTVVVTNTTTTNATNALDVKGDAIKVTPGMQCFVIRHSPTSNMRKTVPCGLLQSYADQSIKPNSAAKNLPAFTMLCAVIAFVLY